MSAQQTQQTVFKYSTPEAGKAKTIVRLCRSDIMYASVHVLTHGGYHRGNVGQVLKSISVAPPRDLYTKFLHQSEPARREGTNAS